MKPSKCEYSRLEVPHFGSTHIMKPSNREEFIHIKLKPKPENTKFEPDLHMLPSSSISGATTDCRLTCYSK